MCVPECADTAAAAAAAATKRFGKSNVLTSHLVVLNVLQLDAPTVVHLG
jgi:hypothetical protein